MYNRVRTQFDNAFITEREVSNSRYHYKIHKQ
jgi:hypothetical protein